MSEENVKVDAIDFGEAPNELSDNNEPEVITESADNGNNEEGDPQQPQPLTGDKLEASNLGWKDEGDHVGGKESWVPAGAFLRLHNQQKNH